MKDHIMAAIREEAAYIAAEALLDLARTIAAEYKTARLSVAEWTSLLFQRLPGRNARMRWAMEKARTP